MKTMRGDLIVVTQGNGGHFNKAWSLNAKNKGWMQEFQMLCNASAPDGYVYSWEEGPFSFKMRLREYYMGEPSGYFVVIGTTRELITGRQGVLNGTFEPTE